MKKGYKKMEPVKKKRELRNIQIDSMTKEGIVKYSKLFEEHVRSTTWQDQLKTNLKIQEDMVFINTPDFKQRAPEKSSLDVGNLLSQIYVYADFGLKPGKYCVIIYDCLDQTLWFKTVVIGLRHTHVLNRNLQMDFSKAQLKDKCRLRFTKEKYFDDKTFTFTRPRPKLQEYL